MTVGGFSPFCRFCLEHCYVVDVTDVVVVSTNQLEIELGNGDDGVE